MQTITDKIRFLLDTNVWLESDRIIVVMTQYSLDFDDAYHYVAAERFGLQLVSFDRDFDQTPLRRLHPSEVT
ncbi:MAG: hypothetical protein KatS3mg023_1206 [Armatimonadota bacterium]|nr:MAG: hypothetical protein KatS3mg023_1206 [Armatimonadota bacterium]